MPLQELSPNVMDLTDASRKRSHEEYIKGEDFPCVGVKKECQLPVLGGSSDLYPYPAVSLNKSKRRLFYLFNILLGFSLACLRMGKIFLLTR